MEQRRKGTCRRPVSELPKTTFKFSGLPEELTELRKAVILMVMVYYSKEIQVKISKDKGAYGRIQERPDTRSPLTSPYTVL